MTLEGCLHADEVLFFPHFSLFCDMQYIFHMKYDYQCCSYLFITKDLSSLKSMVIDTILHFTSKIVSIFTKRG